MNNSSIFSSQKTSSIPNQPNLWQAILIGTASSIMALAIIIGNFIVIRIYLQNKSLQVPNNFYIVSLAIADLLVGIIPINIYTGYLVSGRWPFGGKVCSVWLSLDHILFTISNLSVLAIAGERFNSICRPIYHRIHFKADFAKRTILATWIASFFIWAPPIIIYPRVNKVQFDPYRCKVIFYQYNVPLTVTVVIFSYILPVTVLASFYIAISAKLFELQKNCIEKTSTHVPTLSTVDSYRRVTAIDDNTGNPFQSMRTLNIVVDNVDQDKGNDASQEKSDRRPEHRSKKRAMKLLCMVTVAFVLSWLPYHVTVLIEAATNYVFSDHLWSFCYIIGRLNSFLNPICYAYGNEKFKKGFKKILFSWYKSSGTVKMKSKMRENEVKSSKVKWMTYSTNTSRVDKTRE